MTKTLINEKAALIAYDVFKRNFSIANSPEEAFFEGIKAYQEALQQEGEKYSLILYLQTPWSIDADYANGRLVRLRVKEIIEDDMGDIFTKTVHVVQSSKEATALANKLKLPEAAALKLIHAAKEL